MQSNFSAEEISFGIRRRPNWYAGQDMAGQWWFYAIDDICFIKEKADAPIPMRPLDENEIEQVMTLEQSGKITRIWLSTPLGIYGVTKQLAS